MSNRPHDTGTWGGWRGGLKPSLPEKERSKRRQASHDKYLKGKVKVQIPLDPETAERLKHLKDQKGFSRNAQLLEWLIGLGEADSNTFDN